MGSALRSPLETRMKTIGKIGFLVVLATALCGCSLEVKPGEDLHGAWAYAQMFVEKQLVSPGTARFQPGAVAAGCVRHVGGDEYEVSAYVDAQNRFGGLVRQSFRCRVKRLRNGAKWRLVGDVEWR